MDSKKTKLEHVVFAGDDLVEVARSEGFPEPSFFHGLALELATDRVPANSPPSRIFGLIKGIPFYSQVSLGGRDSRGRGGGTLVHILVPADITSGKRSPAHLLYSLIDKKIFYTFTKGGDLPEEVKKDSPLEQLEVEVDWDRTPSSELLRVDKLLEISGRIIKGRQVHLTGADERFTREALFEVLLQVEKEQRALQREDPIPFALTMYRRDLFDYLSLGVLGQPQNSPALAGEPGDEEEIYYFQDGTFVRRQTAPPPPPEKHPEKVIALFLGLSAFIILIALALILWPKIFPSSTPTPNPSPEVGNKDDNFEKNPPRQTVPKERKLVPLDKVKKPSRESLLAGQAILKAYHPPRHFRVAITDLHLYPREKGHQLRLWITTDHLQKIAVDRDGLGKVRHRRHYLTLEEFTRIIIPLYPRSKALALERDMESLSRRAIPIIANLLKKAGPDELEKVRRQLKQFDLPLGFRHPLRRDRPLNGLLATLDGLAYLAFISVDKSEQAFRWLHQELRRDG